MTVKELQEYLSQLPQDAVIGVLYQMCSDYAVLEEDQMSFVSADGVLDSYSYRDKRRFVLRNGQIMEYDPKTWDQKETPHFVPLLILPGN